MSLQRATGFLTGSGLFLLFSAVLCLLLGFYPSASIAQDEGLFEAEIPVTGQGTEERDAGIREAFSVVLVKVTGLRERFSGLDFDAAGEKAGGFVRSFSYRSERGTGGRQLYLQVRFDEAGVKQYLRANGVGIWDASRPETLLWIAVEKSGQRSVLREGAETPLVREIQASLEQRAMSAILPLMDIEDSINISDIDVWGLFSESIEKASSRYGAKVQLAARLTQRGEIYTGRIRLLFQNQRYDLSVNGLSSKELAVEVADLVGNTLSGFYAVRGGQEKTTPTLIVRGVDSTSDYAEVLSYLSGFSAVRDVAVVKVQGESLRLQLAIDGTLRQLTDAVSLDRKMELLQEERNENQLLEYIWRGK